MKDSNFRKYINLLTESSQPMRKVGMNWAYMESVDEIEEGRIFNNSGEMLRSLLNDISRVMNETMDSNVKSNLSSIINYYKDAELQNSSVTEEFSDNRELFIVMPLPNAPITGWREMQKYFNGKIPMYVRADSDVNGLIISHQPVDNDMTTTAIKQDGLWK